MSSAAFEDLGVLPEIIRAIDEQGWLLPTPIQAESIPLILGGGDVMAVKQTSKQYCVQTKKMYYYCYFICDATFICSEGVLWCGAKLMVPEEPCGLLE